MPIDPLSIIRGASSAVRQPQESMPLAAPMQPEAVPVGVEPTLQPQQPSLSFAPPPEPDPIGDLINTSVGVGISGLAGVGNFLDLATGASSVRDVLALQNPFDQFLSPFSSRNRTSGRDLLTTWGITPENDPNKWELADVAGFAAEVGLDPGTYLSMGLGAIGKAGSPIRNAGLLDDVTAQFGRGALPYTARIKTNVGDFVSNLLKSGDATKISNLAESVKKAGFESIDDYLATHGAEQVGGLFGLGYPFRAASSTLGHGETSQKIATVLDHIFGPASYSKTARTAAAAGRQSPIEETLAQVMGEKYGGYAARGVDPLVHGYDSFKTKVRQLFDDVVGNQSTPEAQEIAANAFRSARGLTKEMAEIEISLGQWNVDAYKAYDEIGEVAWEHMKNRKVVVDPGSLRQMAKDIVEPELAVWAMGENVRRLRQDNIGLINRVRKVVSDGGDVTQVKGWDLFKDEAKYNLPELQSLIDSEWDSGLRQLTGSDDVDSYLVDLLLSSDPKPQASARLNEAADMVREKFEGFRNGAVVRVSSGRLKKQAKDLAEAGEDISTFQTDLTGMVVEAGTKESRVMLRNPNTKTLEERMLPNSRLIGEITDPKAQEIMKNEFLQDKFSGILRMVGEMSDNTVRLGDEVQWTANGVDQFTSPRKVVDIQEFEDGSKWAFFEGSDTAVPLEQLAKAGGWKQRTLQDVDFGPEFDRVSEEVYSSATSSGEAEAVVALLRGHAAWLKSEGVNDIDGWFKNVSYAKSADAVAQQLGSGGKANPRGAFLRGDNAAKAVHAFTSQDISTLAHETGHLFRQSVAEVKPELLVDLEKELGVVNGQWTTEVEESFARGFEKYLADGKAPTSMLAKAFESFKNWLTDLYRSIVGSPLEESVSPQMKAVFDEIVGGAKVRGTSQAQSPLHDAIKHFTGEAGLKRLTPEAEKAFNSFIDSSSQMKNGIRHELDDMGMKVTWLDESIGHFPRYLTKKGVKYLENKGMKGVKGDIDSMYHRSPEISGIPTHIVDGELLTSKRYRGPDAEKNIFEDFSEFLDPRYLEKQDARLGRAPNAAAVVDDVVDGAGSSAAGRGGGMFNDDPLDFDTAALDAAAPAVDPLAVAQSSKAQHAKDLAKWVGEHDRAKLFGNMFVEDMHRYMKQHVVAKSLMNGMYDTVAMNSFPVSDLPGGVTIRQVLEEAPGLDADKAAQFFFKKHGIDPDKFALPPDVANTIKGASKMADPNYVEGWMADMVDSLNSIWKTSVTSPFPAFHVRNLFSGQLNNGISGGVTDIPEYIKGVSDSAAIVKAASTTGQFTDEQLEMITEAFHEGMLQVSHSSVGGGVTADAARSFGVPSVEGSVPTFNPRRTFDEVKDHVLKNPSAIDSLAGGRGADARMALRTFLNSAEDVGRVTEFMNRFPLYLYYRRKMGMSAAEAADRVNFLQLDYTRSTKFEKQVMKRLFPFYSFTRKMSEMMARDLLAHPGGRLAQSIRASRLATTNDYSAPEYVSENISVPFGTLPDGSKRYITGLGLMHESPVKLLSFNENQAYPEMENMGVQLLSQTTPVLKAPLEAIFGESLFQRGPDGGRDLDKMDPTIGRTISNVGEWLGYDANEDAGGRAQPFVSDWFEHFTANSPAARFLSTARTVTDPRKWEGGIFPGSAVAANLLTGARVTDISPGAQDAVLRDTLRRLGEDELDLRTFERAYISKDQLKEMEKIDPDKARRQKQLMEAFKLLADRAKERKKAKSAEKE